MLQLMIMSLIRNRTRPVSPFDFRLFPLQLLQPDFLILHFPVEEIAQVVVMLLALLRKTRDYTFSILLLQLLKQPSFSASFFVSFLLAFAVPAPQFSLSPLLPFDFCTFFYDLFLNSVENSEPRLLPVRLWP